MKNVKTIILCGGIGYRLKEETEFKPKPMVEIGGKPILWHIMKIYSHYGFRDFIIALGYKGNVIKNYFVNQKYYDSDFTLDTSSKRINRLGNSNDKMRITFVDTGVDSLTGERLRRVGKYISEKYFMVTYGDGVADINISNLFRFHKKMKTIGTVTGVYPRAKFGGLDLDKKKIVTKFEKKTQIRQTVNGGFMVFKKEVFNHVKENSVIEDLFYPLIEKRQLAVYDHKGYFHAMDTYQDMEDLNSAWNKNPAWKIWR